MKLTIGAGTPLEVKAGTISVQDGCVLMMEKKNKTGVERMELVIAYRLHPGESLRRIAEGEYDVQQ